MSARGEQQSVPQTRRGRGHERKKYRARVLDGITRATGLLVNTPTHRSARATALLLSSHGHPRANGAEETEGELSEQEPRTVRGVRGARKETCQRLAERRVARCFPPFHFPLAAYPSQRLRLGSAIGRLAVVSGTRLCTAVSGSQ